VTNEQFLYISYFGAAVSGVGLAALTASILARPNRQATESPFLPQLGRFLRRALPPWLILTVLLGFISVSYMECRSYAEVVADRDYLIDKTQEQAYHMALCLAVGLMAYACVLVLFLWARARARRYRTQAQNQ
jgi:hypothetical protein